MEHFTEIGNDIQTILDIFDDKSISEIAKEMGLTETRLLSIKNEEHIPSKEELDAIYNYAYGRRLFLNEITWQESVDKYTQKGIRTVSHGSRTSIKGSIRLDVSGESNDFADGFYIGQSLSQAAMFVGGEPNSSLYILTFDTRDLESAVFNVSTDWMLAVAYFRDRIPEYADHPKIKEIEERVSNCDYVFAPIADNRVFETIDAFTEGLITDKQCLYALSATHLGYQYVLKTQKALSHLDIKKHLYYCPIEKMMYNKEADIESNTSMNKAIIAKKRYTDEGQYISELLGENI